MSNQKKYYESQSSNCWDRQKIEFEAKLEELRQAKDELVQKKQSILSPKHAELVKHKTIEGMQALVVLKEEENSQLHSILKTEKEINKGLADEVECLKKRVTELDSNLNIKQLQCIELQKSLSKYYNSMTILKANLNTWIEVPSSSRMHSGLTSPRQNSELSAIKSENQELKSKLESLEKVILSRDQELEKLKKTENRNDILYEYLKSARSSEIPQNTHNKEKDSKQGKNLFEYGEDSEEEVLKGKIHELVKENERLKQICLDFDDKTKGHQRLKSCQSPLMNTHFEEYEYNLKILKENNNLLSEKIKNLEQEKLKIIQDYKNEEKLTALEISSIITNSYSKKENQITIEANLCKLWTTHDSVFSEMLSTLFGKDCNGLFISLQGKLEKLQKENFILQKRFSFESPKGLQNSLSPKMSFRDAVLNKKFSNSMNQESLKEIVAKNKEYQSNLNQAFENMVTEFSESAKSVRGTQGICYEDLVAFVQCSASALEDCLV